jgi:hypothetical protein
MSEFPAGGDSPCRCTAHPYSLSKPSGAFIASLQQAVEGAGAESVVARNAGEAEQHCDQLQFAAALLNFEHRAIEDDLSARGLPVLLYSNVHLRRKASRGLSGASTSAPTVKLACNCKMSLRRKTRNCRDHDPIRPATERHAGLRIHVGSARAPTGSTRLGVGAHINQLQGRARSRHLLQRARL